MARARLLKPGFFSNETLTELPPFGRLLFAGLWTIADREGRMPDRPKWIKGAIFPYEAVAVDKLLTQLEERRFIHRYEVDGERYIQVVNFDKHQSPHKNEVPSTIPAPEQHASAPSKIGSAQAVAIAIAKADPVAIAKAEPPARSIGFNPLSEPFFPDEPGYVGDFVRNWERRKGEHPGSSMVADAAQLERDFGYEACRQASEDVGWVKPPRWLRPKLDERRSMPAVVELTPRRQSLRYQEA